MTEGTGHAYCAVDVSFVCKTGDAALVVGEEGFTGRRLEAEPRYAYIQWCSKQ